MAVPAGADGGVLAGFWSKKPKGLSQNDTVSAGITGQSSTRVMWWMPKTYQRTTSVSTSGASSTIHSETPPFDEACPARADCVG